MGGTPQMASPTNVFSSAAQETTCNLSPDFQKVVLWNARLRSIAIRSGQRTPENIGRGKKRHKRRQSCWETVHALCIKTSTSLQQTHRNTRSHQKATANQTCPDSRHGNFQVISKCFFPRFFRGVSSMKHIETLTIWYRHRWIDLEPEFWHCGPDMGAGKMLNWKPLDMIWAVFYRNWWFKMVRWPKKCCENMVFHGFVGFTIKMRWHGAILEGNIKPPLAPQWGLASLLDLLLLPLGLMVCITLYRATAACGGGWIAVRWFPRWQRRLSFFKTQSHSSTCKTDDRPIYEPKVHELIIQS